MKNTPDHDFSAAASDPVLNQLCDEIVERLQAGDRVDVSSMAADHPEYAEQFRRLLPALEALVDLGESSARRTDPRISRAGASDPAPRLLGDYLVLREIGRGGMGVVYEAEQRSLNRRVALKVLPMAAALDARQFQRFQLEAQAAACLHHNNIVPVFAVGNEGGVPYYAMQYIEGRSLADVLEELRRDEGLGPERRGPEEGMVPRPADLSTTALARSLVSGQATAPQAGSPDSDSPTKGWNPKDTPEAAIPSVLQGTSDSRPATRKPGSSTRTRDYCRNIAGLGLQAAEALDHAHGRGILHRDIKPGNLMLDRHARLWVTDFGLAQIQGAPGLTLSGDILGTLRYMSPEQALARRVVIDGRTDVYSLGVTLYELLTLRPAIGGKDRAEILRKIANHEPTPLRALNPMVPTDLETIIHKALAKDPSARYATARELADDLRSYIEARPIRARRPTLLDRLAKWGRRNTASVAVGSVLLVVTLIGLTASTILVVREQRHTSAALAQSDARLRLARKAVDEMYTQVAEKWLARQPRLTQVQREFLEKALVFYEQFAAEERDDLEMRLEAARAWLRTGKIQDKLGSPEQAESARRRAIAQLEDLVARYPDHAETSAELANALAALGRQYIMDARPAEAEPLVTRAVANYESLVAGFPGVRKYSLGLASSLGQKLQLRMEQRRWREAETEVRRGRDILLKLLTDAPRDRDCLRELADQDMSLGGVLLGTGRYREAEEADRLSVTRFDALLTEDPTDADLRHRLAVSLSNQSFSLDCTGRLDDSIACSRRSEELLRFLVNEFPDVPEYRAHLASGEHHLALTLRKAGRLEEAIRTGELGVQEGEALVREQPTVLKYRQELARCLSALAVIHSTWREERFYDPPRALRLARRAIEVAPEGDAWQCLGWAQYRLGDLTGCIKSMEKETNYSRDGDFIAAMAYWRLGDLATARAMFARADTWLRRYEMLSRPDTYPEAPVFRRLREEAAALLGVASALTEAQPKPPD